MESDDAPGGAPPEPRIGDEVLVRGHVVGKDGDGGIQVKFPARTEGLIHYCWTRLTEIVARKSLRRHD